MTNGVIPIFSTKFKKIFIVKKARNIEVKNPIARLEKFGDISKVCASIIKKNKAPNIVGIPNINENLEASLRFIPMNKAAVMAVPDRDAPGISAKH